MKTNNSIRRAAIIGRGAVGLTMASFLEQGRQQGVLDEFVFIADPDRVSRYRNTPLEINDQPIDFHYLSTDENKPEMDLVLFTCKSFALEEAMEEAAPFIDVHTIVMSALNGMNSEEHLQKRFPKNRVIHTIAQKMDSGYDPKAQKMTFTKPGELVIGVIDPSLDESLDEVCVLFDACGLPYIRSEQILKDQASKLMANCGINQVCAAYGKTYGQVVSDPDLRALLKGAMNETRKVLALRDLDPGEEKVDAWVAAFEALDPDSRPSMAQDVLYGRPMEMDLFSGSVVPIARENGIEVPILEDLYERLKRKGELHD